MSPLSFNGKPKISLYGKYRTNETFIVYCHLSLIEILPMGIVNILCDPTSYSVSVFGIPRVGYFIRLDAELYRMNFLKNFPSWNETLSTDTEEKYEISVILAIM
jgi:hypothetical protein